jgi:transposase-like protein
MSNLNCVSDELLSQFADEVLAHRFIATEVWPDGLQCPHCKRSTRIGQLHGRSTPEGTYKCYKCRKLFSVRAGTIFEFSHVPLHKWLQAAYLSGCGTEKISPRELSEVLNVTYKTSVLILDRLSKAAVKHGVAPHRSVLGLASFTETNTRL